MSDKLEFAEAVRVTSPEEQLEEKIQTHERELVTLQLKYQQIDGRIGKLEKRIEGMEKQLIRVTKAVDILAEKSSVVIWWKEL